MQSLLSFCSICLQLSSLGSKKSEILLKRDESCTLCITELLQPSNSTTPSTNDQFYREILNKGNYFDNPVLQEALKLKLEQQILIGSHETSQEKDKTDEVQESPSKMRPQPSQQEIEELLEKLVQTVQSFSPSSSFEKQVKEDLMNQVNQVDQMIVKKVLLLEIINKKANLELPNKLSFSSASSDLKMSGSDIESLKGETRTNIQYETDFQLRALASTLHKNFQAFSDKVQKLKNKIAQPQKSRNLAKEISDLQNKASQELERIKSFIQLNLKATMQKLYWKSKEILEYAKPIKNGLKTGEKLTTNGHLTSENGVFNLVMQQDWNLVLYKFSTPIWSTRTYDGWSTGTQPELFFDKNSGILKIQGSNSARVNEVNPANQNYSGDAHMTINNNGTITITGSNQELWRPNELISLSDTFNSDHVFTPSDVLVSKNGIYSLILDQDCVLALYKGAIPIWTPGTAPAGYDGQCQLRLNEKGSLTIQKGTSVFPVFPESATNPGKTSLLVADDGVLVIKSGDQVTWRTKMYALLEEVILPQD